MLGTLVSLCIFLAYGTTASVARQVGAGNTRGRARPGHRRALAGDPDRRRSSPRVALPLTGPIVDLFGPGARVADLAVTYLRIALLGTVPLLLMLAATGVLRGLQDTRTPLVVAVRRQPRQHRAQRRAGLRRRRFDGLGIAGSALGTLLAQVGSAVALVWVVVRAARRESALAATATCPGSGRPAGPAYR